MTIVFAREEHMTSPTTRDLQTLARDHLYPHFTRGAAWSDAQMPVIVRGDGCFVYDDTGARFLDGLAGLFCVNMGHGRTDIAEAASAQMVKLAYWTNWSAAHPAAVEAATLIAGLAPDGLERVFFVNSGSEAVESAIKLARQYFVSQGQPDRTKIIARDMAYHGTTLGALAVTGIPKFKKAFGPLMRGVRHFPHTLGEALPESGTAADLPSLRELVRIIEEEGAETVAALFVEPVQNSRGALVPPNGYWRELRSICDRYGILLVADEVICAFGRLGDWFGSAKYGATPDLITFAKGSTSGYSPLGGVIVSEHIAHEVLNSPLTGSFTHGSTWGGHPVATAVASANITAMRDEDVLSNVRSLEAHFQTGLGRIVNDHRCLREWRGAGFFYALEFVRDRDSRTELSEDESLALLRQVMPDSMRRNNLITRPDDRGATMLMLSPPLVADRGIIDDLLERVDNVVKDCEAYLGS